MADAKRHKSAGSPIATAEADLGPLNPALLTRRAVHASACAAARPYPHHVLEQLCLPGRVGAIRDEILQNLDGTFKETDLFKLYQTIDLANLDTAKAEHAQLCAVLPELMALRDALYTPAFRAFISEVAGVGDLTDRVDMAASAYTQGCHLLCHDDVIGTRAVSFIVYLTDEGWCREDGGALELYPSAGSPPVPSAAPSAGLLPLRNTLALFPVTPGRSYHSVQEVFTDRAPRLSIQGWYHAAAPPEGAEMASLNQLKSNNSELAFEAQAVNAAADASAIDESDARVLRAWITDAYLQPANLANIRKQFTESGSVQLKRFLRESVAASLGASCTTADEAASAGGGGRPEYNAGLGAGNCGWEAVGPAHMQRYLRFSAEQERPAGAAAASAAETVGSTMEQIRSELFAAPAFWRLVHRLTGLLPQSQRSQVRRFRPGLDYTVAHHGLLEDHALLDATLCVLRPQSAEEQGLWDSGDAGGFECYIAAENGELVAAEVYGGDDDQDNELLSVNAAPNTLNLVHRDPGTMRFLKYVGSAAPCSRFDISGTFELRDETAIST